MTKTALAVFGAVSLFALPSLAQSSNPANATQSTTNQSNANQSTTARTMPTQQVRQKLMSDLQNAGYTNVHIIPDSFLVHATNKQGDPVVMIINPDSVFAVTKLPADQVNGSTNATGSHPQGLGNPPNTTTRQ